MLSFVSLFQWKTFSLKKDFPKRVTSFNVYCSESEYDLENVLYTSFNMLKNH